MTSAGKVRSLREAVAEFVHDGDALFLSGMQHGEPSAAIHEILRQGMKDLTLIPQLPDVGQLLITEGRVRRLLTAYTGVLDGRRGVLAARAAEQSFELVEFSHGALALALLATQLGVPFLPTRALLGSDYLRVNREFLREATSPFDDGPVAAVRALAPDVAIVHVQVADREGNAQKQGSLGMDVAGVHAARRVIVTAERIVEPDVIRSDAAATTIPSLIVDAVVEVPWGAWPQHLIGCYAGDLRSWMGVFADDNAYVAHVRDDICGTVDHAGFIDRMRARFGDEHFDRLHVAAVDPNAELKERMASR